MPKVINNTNLPKMVFIVWRRKKLAAIVLNKQLMQIKNYHPIIHNSAIDIWQKQFSFFLIQKKNLCTLLVRSSYKMNVYINNYSTFNRLLKYSVHPYWHDHCFVCSKWWCLYRERNILRVNHFLVSVATEIKP